MISTVCLRFMVHCVEQTMTEDDGSEFPQEALLPLISTVGSSLVYVDNNIVQLQHPEMASALPDTSITLSTEGYQTISQQEAQGSRTPKYKKGNKQNRPSPKAEVDDRPPKPGKV